MLSLCSHKAACSAKTNYRLKPMIKTTLGLLSSCFNCSLCSKGDLWIQHLFLSTISADVTAGNKGFQARVSSEVHKTFTLVPPSSPQSPSHLPTCSKGIFDEMQKGRCLLKSLSSSFKSINSNSITTRKSCNKILSSWYPTSSCCSVYIKLCGTCWKPDRLKSWCLLSRTHLTLGSHAIFLGCLHSC